MQANISSIKSVPSITIMPHQGPMSTPMPVCVSSYQATPPVPAVVLAWSQSACLSISSTCVPGYQASLSIPSSMSNQASSSIPQPVIMTSNQSTQSPHVCQINQLHLPLCYHQVMSPTRMLLCLFLQQLLLSLQTSECLNIPSMW